MNGFLDESLTTTAPQDTSSSATPWIAGGILVALAIGVFALEKKGPAPVRRAA